MQCERKTVCFRGRVGIYYENKKMKCRWDVRKTPIPHHNQFNMKYEKINHYFIYIEVQFFWWEKKLVLASTNILCGVSISRFVLGEPDSVWYHHDISFFFFFLFFFNQVLFLCPFLINYWFLERRCPSVLVNQMSCDFLSSVFIVVLLTTYEP